MYLWARTGEEVDDSWTCATCGVVNDGNYGDESIAVKHVMNTGHSVVMSRERSYIIHAVRSDVIPEATLF